jgi:putative peptidoglycan lipid II flippase
MAVVLWMTTGTGTEWLAAAAPERIARLAGIVVSGAAAYFAALWALGFRLRDFSRKGVE